MAEMVYGFGSLDMRQKLVGERSIVSEHVLLLKRVGNPVVKNISIVYTFVMDKDGDF